MYIKPGIVPKEVRERTAKEVTELKIAERTIFDIDEFVKDVVDSFIKNNYSAFEYDYPNAEQIYTEYLKTRGLRVSDGPLNYKIPKLKEAETNWSCLSLFHPRNVHGLHFSGGSKTDKRYTEAREFVDYNNNFIFDGVIENILGNSYNGLYLSPAQAPFNWNYQVKFPKKGNWTLVDIMRIDKTPEYFDPIFTNWNYVYFDIRNTPSLPDQLNPESYDIVVAFGDWAGEGKTWELAEILLRENGLFLTSKDRVERIRWSYDVAYDPELENHPWILIQKMMDAPTGN